MRRVWVVESKPKRGRRWDPCDYVSLRKRAAQIRAHILESQYPKDDFRVSQYTPSADSDGEG